MVHTTNSPTRPSIDPVGWAVVLARQLGAEWHTLAGHVEAKPHAMAETTLRPVDNCITCVVSVQARGCAVPLTPYRDGALGVARWISTVLATDRPGGITSRRRRPSRSCCHSPGERYAQMNNEPRTNNTDGGLAGHQPGDTERHGGQHRGCGNDTDTRRSPPACPRLHEGLIISVAHVATVAPQRVTPHAPQETPKTLYKRQHRIGLAGMTVGAVVLIVGRVLTFTIPAGSLAWIHRWGELTLGEVVMAPVVGGWACGVRRFAPAFPEGFLYS